MAEGEGFDRRQVVSLLQEATMLIGEYSGSSDTLTTRVLKTVCLYKSRYLNANNSINERTITKGKTDQVVQVQPLRRRYQWSTVLGNDR
jgi:hypothetical protein